MDDGSKTPSAVAISADLDVQLKDYLNLLDEYQTLRRELSAACAKGFLSLAQANFSSPNRIRHGQDFYDDRMQASTRVTSISSVGKFAVSSETVVSGEKDSKDPLRWYGLLIPPALRQSQASFGQVVKGLVPRLLNVTRELEVLGARIEETRARKESVK